jgi:Domain of unknown function (DUF4439)
VLVALAGSVVAASGCTASDPRITSHRSPGAGRSSAGGSPSPSGGSSPTTSGQSLSGAAAGARAEQHAAAGAVTLLDAKPGPNRRQRDLIEGVRDAHLAHAHALLSPDPADRPAGRASAAKDTGRGTLPALQRREERLAGRHLQAAVATRGLAALLWASLGVAAQSYAAALADAGPPTVSATTGPDRPAVVSDVAAQQAVVSALHALVYGYQVAIGRLAGGSAARARADAGLLARRALRDRLVTHLIEVEADVPDALPAYALPIPVTNATSAGGLIRRMELAFLPYLGQWVAAAARTSDRRLAVRSLAAVSASAGAWGAPPQVWPGWP